MRCETIEFSIVGVLVTVMLAVFSVIPDAMGKKSDDINIGSKNILFTYALSTNNSAEAKYDEAAVVASIQGLINRENPQLYVLSSEQSRPQYWLDILSADGGWLTQKKRVVVEDMDDLVRLAGKRLKGAVIWDPKVPATFNVATTIAGIKDAVVLSPEFAQKYLAGWNLPVVEDLRGRFDGSVTGSSKNDAYRWAIEMYLAKGLCSSRLLCLFEDSAATRSQGSIAYVVTRDWAVKNRAFVFDLSVWADETPKDDPDQPLGTDLAIYKMIPQETLNQSAGKHMTEMTGFFAFWKYSNIPGYPSKHEPVPTEWETVYLMTPYNCYQNTASHLCYNQSLHSQAPFSRLKQRRPAPLDRVEDKAYICILMADYDSAFPLYDYLPKFWDDPNRGKIPLVWGINPNLLETYPDVITHYYNTATQNDSFASDASAAGYMNPNRIKAEYLPLFVKHNKKFFDMADMTMAPMVLDWNEPTSEVKDAFAQFAPDGYATILYDFHAEKEEDIFVAPPSPHVWKGMPVVELINDICNPKDAKKRADEMYDLMVKRGHIDGQPGFYFFRIVWDSPSEIIKILDHLKKSHPKLDFEVVDPYNFFSLFKKNWQSQQQVRINRSKQ